jgi:hypothetical protein
MRPREIDSFDGRDATRGTTLEVRVKQTFREFKKDMQRRTSLAFQVIHDARPKAIWRNNGFSPS